MNVQRVSVLCLIVLIAFCVSRVAPWDNEQESVCPSDLSLQAKYDLITLNKLLSAEYMFAAFFKDGLDKFSLEESNWTSTDYGYLELIRDQEMEHVANLTQMITSLGGIAIQDCEYDFGLQEDFDSFLQNASNLANQAVGVYLRYIPVIADRDALMLVSSIATVEGRHASWLNYMAGQSPFPNAFDSPFDGDNDYTTSCPDFNSMCYGMNSGDDGVCGGHGTCEGPDLCVCEGGWGGPHCNCTFSSCEICSESDLCCNDTIRGSLCYDPNVYNCINDESGNTVLCGIEDDACGTICYNTTFYECVDGSIQPISSAFAALEHEAQMVDHRETVVQKKLIPKDIRQVNQKVTSDCSSPILHTFLVLVLALFLLL